MRACFLSFMRSQSLPQHSYTRMDYIIRWPSQPLTDSKIDSHACVHACMHVCLSIYRTRALRAQASIHARTVPMPPYCANARTRDVLNLQQWDHRATVVAGPAGVARAHAQLAGSPVAAVLGARAVEPAAYASRRGREERSDPDNGVQTGCARRVVVVVAR
jgi:hypothetical protein